MSQFAAHSVALGRLFASPFLFETPGYQRSYSWTKEEAGRLLEDICAALDAEPETAAEVSADYFLGTMLLIDRDAAAAAQRAAGWPLAGDPRAFEIVDGLQRLTTLTILFCALRDIAVEEDEACGDGLLGAIHGGPSSRPRPWLRLRGSDEAFFQAYVRALSTSGPPAPVERLASAEKRIAEVREHFLEALSEFEYAQRARLAEFLLARCFVVLIATTGIDRAHRMFMVLNERGKPLARNDILKADHFGRVAPAALASATATWEAIEARLGEDFETLFSHVRAMHGRPGGHVIAGIRAIAAESGGPERFIEEVLKPAALAFDNIRNSHHAGSPHSPAISSTLGYLNRLSARDWVPSAMLWWQTRSASPAQIAWFLKRLERLAYGLRIVGLGAAKRTQRFSSLVAAMRSGRSLELPGSPLALTGAEERTIRYNLRDLHARSPQTCKLILLRLNDAIAGSRAALDWDQMSVEHVLPRKHGANSHWREWFADPEERDSCVESLGNLLLVTKAQNDRAGNAEFARKREIYFGSGSSVPALNEPLRTLAEWKPAHVRAREAELFRQLDALWDFGLTAARNEARAATEPMPERRRARATRGRGG